MRALSLAALQAAAATSSAFLASDRPRASEPTLVSANSRASEGHGLELAVRLAVCLAGLFGGSSGFRAMFMTIPLELPTVWKATRGS